MRQDLSPTARRVQTGLRWVLVAFYGLAGWLHLHSPHGFEQIVPPFVPYPHMVVLATGVAELLGAAGLLMLPVRWAAGWGLAAYALCVWPANFYHAFAHVAIDGVALGWGYHAPRLLFQPVLIWAALYASEVTGWPFARNRKQPAVDL
jgi:uncharacterized membrane protein